ncbi:hypothetical protein EXU57_04050 [Segetibacter sp. 3557_3]|uniref:DUF6544 family protein n=1 Tax=Segetibacter sp. 3557_3 TaxID=2547429 RepID=UPI001058A742|nr:DUF6544 family protein [Segetibacter sp. 3557_3]TDH29247.1 hypothetical protein EXU57_04050 [Segetibacter sp. 3557_3]
MLRMLFLLIITLHGLIHFMGFAKAYQYGNITQLTRPISRQAGILWLIAALLFLAGALLFLLKKESWWMILLPAAVISQLLIIGVWSDAKFGTIANVIIAVAAVLTIGTWIFERTYKRDVAENTKGLPATANLLIERDLDHLPPAVQRYLRYVGVINKPKVYNYKIIFRGEMRDKGKDWFPFTSEQYNFVDRPTRLFFMKGTMFGVTVPGYHAYKNGNASMQIKLFGLFPIVNETTGVLNKAETVTIFNDMCLMAPASLIDPSIKWEQLSENAVNATYTVKENTVSATLYFNDHGQLVDFVSDDRYAIAEKRKYRFSTPVSDYKTINGFNLPGYGEAVWHYPDGKFTYGKFYLKDVQYNIQ